MESDCIPVTPNGSTTRPPFQLVDPDSFLAALYLPGTDHCFPHGAYAAPDVLAVLRRLGMRHELEHVSWDDLLERATALAALTQSSSEAELEKGDPCDGSERGAMEGGAARVRQIVGGLLGIMAQKLDAGDTVENRRAAR